MTNETSGRGRRGDRLRIALISPKGPLYRHRGGIFGKSLRYMPLTLPTLAALALRASGRERVVLLPPAVHKSFWVEQDRVSPEYLEQMGYFLLQLILNVTPQSIDHQSRLLLQYAAPAAAGPPADPEAAGQDGDGATRAAARQPPARGPGRRAHRRPQRRQ